MSAFRKGGGRPLLGPRNWPRRTRKIRQLEKGNSAVIKQTEKKNQGGGK